MAYTPAKCRAISDRHDQYPWHDPDPPRQTTRTSKRLRRNRASMESTSSSSSLPFIGRRMVVPLLTGPQKAFNMPYSLCGCCLAAPSPRSPSRSPEGLRSMMGRFLRSPKQSPSPPAAPAMETILAALRPLAARDVDATHRSGHHLEDAGPTG